MSCVLNVIVHIFCEFILIRLEQNEEQQTQKVVAYLIVEISLQIVDTVWNQINLDY